MANILRVIDDLGYSKCKNNTAPCGWSKEYLWLAIHFLCSYHNNVLNGNVLNDGTSFIIDVNQVNDNVTQKQMTIPINRA